MRAVLYRKHSPNLDVYEYSTDRPDPEPAVDGVVIRVAYAALNRLDDWVRRGWPGLKLDWPHIPGSDLSGTIEAVGAAVEGWEVGQRVAVDPMLSCGRCAQCLAGYQNRCVRGVVLGEHVSGACAGYVAVPARNLVAVPDGYGLDRAAAAPLVYVTAWHSLIRAGELQPGEHLLVVGAGGGVNSASIQIAKRAGARVSVVASTPAKAERALALGADWAHDRSAEPDWSRAVYLATGRRGVDLVVDNVGEATWPSSLRTLAPGGRLLTVGGTSGYGARVPVNLIFARHLRIVGSTMGTHADFSRVMDLIFRGELEPVVDSIYPLSKYSQALQRMLADKHFGKILLEVNPG